MTRMSDVLSNVLCSGRKTSGKQRGGNGVREAVMKTCSLASCPFCHSYAIWLSFPDLVIRRSLFFMLLYRI
jgi:hypothetical protein